MDHLQQIEDIMGANKDVLQRLDSFWENQDLFYRTKQCLQMGYKVYCIITVGDKSHEGELVDAVQWTPGKVHVKLHNGSIIIIPVSSINRVKCHSV